MSIKLITKYLPLLFAIFAGTAAAEAQGYVTPTLHIKIQNRQQLLRKLQREQEKLREQWQAELERKRNEIKDDVALSESVSLTVKPDVALELDENGEEEMNLKVTFSYETMPNNMQKVKVGNQTDDYPAGAYTMAASKACRLTCDFLKNKIEGELKEQFKPGQKVTIKITGSTDASRVASRIPYKGEYGELNNRTVYVNGSLAEVSVTTQSGITSNTQLAFLRTQGVKDFMDRYIDQLSFTTNRYQFYAVESKAKGSQYRRIDIELIMHGAYNAQMNELPDAKKRYHEEVPEISDADENIPRSGRRHGNVLALVIANEKYCDERQNAAMPNVNFAENDGDVMAEYIKRAIGLEDNDQIKVIKNASFKQMENGFEWLVKNAQSFGADGKIIIYYAGHATPCGKEGTVHLVPTDANPNKESDMISLNKIYGELAKLPSAQVLCLWDACFSGMTRAGKPLGGENQRAIKVTERPIVGVGGNTIVFAAADASQKANAYTEQKHGLFTYYLLKNIQKGGADITLGQLFDGLQSQVKKKAELKEWEQTPTFTAAKTMKDKWRVLRLY